MRDPTKMSRSKAGRRKMSDDLEQRADDYEAKVARAGSTESIISGLVRGAERNQRVVKWLAVSIVLDVLLSIALGTVALTAQQNAADADRASRVADKAANVACVQSAKNSTVVNNLLDALIINTVDTEAFTAEEQKRRLASFKALLIDVPDCFETSEPTT